MAKTLVATKHEAGPAHNGYGGCHARYAEGGMCPGVSIARWLNGLGDDDEFYMKPTKVTSGITNGKVRDNWLRENDHIVALQPALARLRAEERRLAADLRRTRRDLKLLQKQADEGMKALHAHVEKLEADSEKGAGQ